MDMFRNTFFIVAPNLNLTDKINTVKSIPQIRYIITKYIYQQSDYKITKKCPLNTNRRNTLKIKHNEVDWKSCVKEIIKESLNCTFGVCKKILFFDLQCYDQSTLKNQYFYSAHGSEFLELDIHSFIHQVIIEICSHYSPPFQ